MSYATVWVNGVLVGGWPYGYASFRLELTSFLEPGENQLAIRIDQALDSSRWYPGAGIYRNVWLTKVHTTHVGQFGTRLTSREVSSGSAIVDVEVQVENAATSGGEVEVQVTTDLYEIDASTGEAGASAGQFPNSTAVVAAGKIVSASGSLTLQDPKLWGPKPSQEPHLYLAVTRLYLDGQEIDSYETKFGIRSLEYDGDGLKVNGERVYIQGVCQHHDLGSLGAAFNIPAAERQLEMLQDMGSNAIRTSHNPRPGAARPRRSPGVQNDFQTIFGDWSEPDLRAFIRRDRNHPSIWAWSYGNEVAEQRSNNGASAAQRLRDIVHEEDDTRKTTIGMNNAGPDTQFTSIVDLIGLNYQGEGKGNGGPTFENFRGKYPDKMIFSTESSSVVSSRGTYLFPVTGGNNAIVGQNGAGDRYPYVAGEFVWTGWDYIGEPTPYDSSRSSYFGIIDLAGFPKDRFYLYQARWNPEVKMAHILPHWNWPDRVGQVTPVHVFSSGDEAELFVNGVSQGRKKKEEFTYRFRWDDVKYEAGEVHVFTYKNGAAWANATVSTTEKAAKLQLSTYKDRDSIRADGSDLVFVSVAVVDDKGYVVPDAEPSITFSVQGPGEIVTTDNGDPTDMVPFPSKERNAFRGRALAIVRAQSEASETITLSASADGLEGAEITLTVA
ncbi:unnamed protein product [Parascedosporium putredinis]|uniref:Beta-galactosidase n=1 Tax=Parascedosporium putredinis TaxID=1442378 RepID=A0A9P1MCE0_9PEZI|nr:unnamed protein product [Parascedosporium putredinis]CAI8000552.1 unnamed protein product [Parascedosporium putredinis]